jgi:predicted amidohydrolase
VARETEIIVAAGLTERAPDRVYNTALLIGPDGRLLGLHRKINLLDIEQPWYGVGDRLGVIRTPLGVVGLNICADNFRNSLALGHALGRMGARLLLSPSAWALGAGHTNEQTPYDEWFEPYATLARLYDLTVIGVSNVGWIRGGPWKGKQCIGSSLAVGPGGVLLARAPYGVEAESLTVVEAPLPPESPKGTLLLQQLREKGYEGI